MRTKAFILFFPFAVFLFETASFIPVMANNCTIAVSEQNTCSNPEPAEDCSNKKANSSCKTEKNQDTGKQEDPSENCEDNPDCTTCPVCYTFIFQSLYEWPAHQFHLRNNYALLNTGCISFYISAVWKPPNGLSHT